MFIGILIVEVSVHVEKKTTEKSNTSSSIIYLMIDESLTC